MLVCSACKTTKSIRESSFFAKSRLPLKKWMLVMYWWARQYPVSDCKDETEIAANTQPLTCTSGYMRFAALVSSKTLLLCSVDEA